MRTNLPVTNVEYILKDSDMVVSKTDLQGNIIYANRDFIEISGYSEAELLGAPQNILRHPDMPQEAFADMWRSLKSGRSRAAERCWPVTKVEIKNRDLLLTASRQSLL